MFIQALHLKDFLSFQDVSIELGPVNVLIGANGSGKSNLIDAIDFLRHCPGDLSSFVLNEGGADQWIRRATKISSASLEAYYTFAEKVFDYELSFRSSGRAPSIGSERLRKRFQEGSWGEFSRSEAKFEWLAPNEVWEESRRLPTIEPVQLRPNQTFLSQYRNPSDPTSITGFSEQLQKVRIYRNFATGKRSDLRRGAPVSGADDPQLNESASNLAYALHELDNQDRLNSVNAYLTEFAPHYEGVKPRLVNGAWTLQLREEGLDSPTPTERISEGTLKFLCLLAILLDPNPPPLICIDEPEVGLHPEAISLVGKAIQDAEQRTQLIIATHCEALVDTFSDRPEAVIVCEKAANNTTTLTKQSRAELEGWLETYALGSLWQRGVLGGNRR